MPGSNLPALNAPWGWIFRLRLEVKSEVGIAFKILTVYLLSKRSIQSHRSDRIGHSYRIPHHRGSLYAWNIFMPCGEMTNKSQAQGELWGVAGDSFCTFPRGENSQTSPFVIPKCGRVDVLSLSDNRIISRQKFPCGGNIPIKVSAQGLSTRSMYLSVM